MLQAGHAVRHELAFGGRYAEHGNKWRKSLISTSEGRISIEPSIGSQHWQNQSHSTLANGLGEPISGLKRRSEMQQCPPASQKEKKERAMCTSDGRMRLGCGLETHLSRCRRTCLSIGLVLRDPMYLYSSPLARMTCVCPAFLPIRKYRSLFLSFFSFRLMCFDLLWPAFCPILLCTPGSFAADRPPPNSTRNSSYANRYGSAAFSRGTADGA